MAGAHVAALVQADALTTVKNLDHPLGDAHVDLGVDEGVRNRVEEALDLDVIIDIDARPLPLGELPIRRWQGAEGVALYFLEQLSSADPQLAHRPAVHRLHGARDGGVAFGEREEDLPPQAPRM
ncbi:hypothetical+protein [Methylocapsa aurea]